jgi:hypothetical protein
MDSKGNFMVVNDSGFQKTKFKQGIPAVYSAR